MAPTGWRLDPGPRGKMLALTWGFTYPAEMNKAQLIDTIAPRFASRADAARALDAVTGAISDALAAGDSVSLVGFGTFERRHRPARTVRNPQTGATMETQAKDVPAFRPGATLKERVATKPKKARKAAQGEAVDALTGTVAPAEVIADVVASDKKAAKALKTLKKAVKKADAQP